MNHVAMTSARVCVSGDTAAPMSMPVPFMDSGSSRERQIPMPMAATMRKTVMAIPDTPVRDWTADSTRRLWQMSIMTAMMLILQASRPSVPMTAMPA
ncbi:MAG: hypothetical protein BWX71_02511 [Deltaproteobacteria bacterium ADurb.Bin072]|nr:MAG: hypothetical protein BWX71_02511 [Deltaproteobacteria bacterium ADurb.Bin072]